jgi:protein-disulfide isomerase
MNHPRRKMIVASVVFLLLISGPGMSQTLIDLNESPSFSSKGDKAAKIVLLEFADYQCPFCARFHRETFPQIDKDYISTEKIRFVFRNFPLERSHPDAFKAAEAALCAGEQGKFWSMHSWLFNLQSSSRFNDWVNYAQRLDLDAAQFMNCLDADSTAAMVRKDVSDGKSAGVKVTPTFLLGVADPKTSQMKVFNKIEGAEGYSTFKKALDSLIAMEK